MTKTLSIIAITLFICGCSSMQPGSGITQAEQHQAGKTQYYENLNQRPINTAAEFDEAGEQVTAELEARLK